MHWLTKHKVVIGINLLLFSLILLVSFIWEFGPLRVEGVDSERLIHYTIHIILLPLLIIYLPLKLIRQRSNSGKKAYFAGLILCVLAGLASATYTHTVSVPGSFLFKIEGGTKQVTDPDYDHSGENNSYMAFTISTSIKGYDKPLGPAYFYVEAFLHSIFYCFYMLCYLQAYGIMHKHKLKEKLKQQQLDVLQYQLNPHFLFNSLNSIRGMLYEDVSEAKKLLLEFRQLFKHHFDNKQHCIALKQELLLCRHYLKLEKVRFEERLNVDLKVPSECEIMLVPSMSIFTLIENAIKHGIGQIPSGGTIAISVAKQDKKLSITVSNPINKTARQADGTRTGLANLEARLALLYRDNFTINSERSDDQFSVELQIPLKKDKTGE
ncbi:sensor histidine kinase [Pseudoalteromonas spongiae]|uniref:sensor histidine kinase n=1 Tax=Pseudoalteromonas spongiae TaxID=298657 RepID=UPI000C2D259A|nr:histidine kinase [Pseudoalteromonas spongiae]